MSGEKIKFKTLHEGVGFHPFSEGLPYAPQSQAQSSHSSPISKTAAPKKSPAELMGVGAMSAGTPTFVNSAANTAARTTRQIQQAQQQQMAAEIAVHQPIPTPKPAAHHFKDPGVIRKRIFAFLLDTTIHLGFWILVNLIAIFALHFEIDSMILAQNWGSFLVFFAFSQTVFIGMQNMLFDNSLGKYFFGLEFKRNREIQLKNAAFSVTDDF